MEPTEETPASRPARARASQRARVLETLLVASAVIAGSAGFQALAREVSQAAPVAPPTAPTQVPPAPTPAPA
ncbi:MAG: glycoside hydrolase, partial [Phycisphaerae bacterium]|nr:glycoside hydrolase [Phycisphaerae bacterium]